MSKQDKAALRYLETKGVTNYNDKMRMIGSLKHDVPNLRLNKGKFVTAGLRLYYNHELTNYDSITINIPRKPTDFSRGMNWN